MDEVIITGTIRARCNVAGGRFQWLTIPVQTVAPDAGPGADYTQELYAAGEASIPANCTAVTVTVDTVERSVVQSEGGATSGQTTIPIDVYVTCGAEEFGPYSQLVDVDVGTAVTDIRQLIQDQADLLLSEIGEASLQASGGIDSVQGCTAYGVVSGPIYSRLSPGM